MLLKEIEVPISHESGPGNDEACIQRVPLLSHAGLAGMKGISHAVFSRHGGVSPPPYEALNTSYNTDDLRQNVESNLQIIRRALGASHLKTVNQVHGSEIQVLKSGQSEETKGGGDADAIICEVRRTALMIKLADCQGVILYDPVSRVVANVHCGWRGNRCNILGQTVERMKSDFGCEGKNIMAAIGPSLGPCCAEFVDHQVLFPEAFRSFMVRENVFDLWAISRMQLAEAGVRAEHIEVAGICTKCRTDLFYSYRAEGVTGRFATVVMLE